MSVRFKSVRGGLSKTSIAISNKKWCGLIHLYIRTLLVSWKPMNSSSSRLNKWIIPLSTAEDDNIANSIVYCGQ